MYSIFSLIIRIISPEKYLIITTPNIINISINFANCFIIIYDTQKNKSYLCEICLDN